MGNAPQKVPQEVQDFPSNKSAVFQLRIEHCSSWGMDGVYNFVADCIKIAYPNATLSKEYSSSGRGQFLIEFNQKNGQLQQVWNRKTGDGMPCEKNILSILERIKKQAEGA